MKRVQEKRRSKREDREDREEKRRSRREEKRREEKRRKPNPSRMMIEQSEMGNENSHLTSYIRKVCHKAVSENELECMRKEINSPG